MTRLSLPPLLSLILCLAVSACSADLASESQPPGKADVLGPDQAPTFFVYYNGTECQHAPCPSYTAIDMEGDLHDVASVDLPDSPGPSDLSTGGLEVQGDIAVGSWQPGGDGDILVVSNVTGTSVEVLPRDNGTECITDPCPRVTALTGDGSELEVAEVDLTPLNLPEAEVEALRDEISVGERVVRGWLRHTDWQPGSDGTVLHVTQLSGASLERYHVFDNGTACPVAPCPNWTLNNGGATFEAASLNLSMLGLPAADEQALLQQFADGLWIAEGWLAEGSWDPGGPGNVLHVSFFHH